ncbi:superoxide dismutase family protein [Hyphomonas sp.]|uniref:superoxide dismutase family protein n=1 Tax=Hyphomonas sp. TaxID=87 RepID=UPI0039189600
MPVRFTLAATVLALGACASAPPHDAMADQEMHMKMMAAPPAPANARGALLGPAGTAAGTVTAVQGMKGVLLKVEVNEGALTPGWHGIHLHAVGDCSDLGTYKKSGGHQGMTEGGHGLLNPEGPEEGDLPNIWVAENGAAKYEAHSSLFELAPVLDADGLALVIHEAADDHVSQPIGGAGARVACAVIEEGGS